MSARGRRFCHQDAVRLSLQDEITFLCGHYKDVDHRVAEHLATEELSLGDFIVSGGEIPALAMLDAVVRLPYRLRRHAHRTPHMQALRARDPQGGSDRNTAYRPRGMRHILPIRPVWCHNAGTG